jgi:hypothetical protein
MAEQPALNRFYVASYAANDKDFPVLAVRLDPRVAGYRVPEDLSPHPDSKRYPNHVFTGSQPSNGDERVTHIYEILPAPWVPFTRYDDDLGPIQGRRRAVKNEGQQADLTSDRKISYEGREGSSIVSLEIEETWSIKTDEDGNSLFPIKDRDFYDTSRGPVQERRQLFVPTGEEVGSLENVNGVITQTSYEPYNEFLSVKIVQTYSVDGPQLIGKTTDNDGQLVTVTTQRKAALNYTPPNPTATRSVEVSREDAESLIERVVDTPEVFSAKTFSVERPDPIPQKFRVVVPLETDQEVIEGIAEIPVLQKGDISRSEEQRNKFLKRISSTSRDQTVLPQTLVQKSTDNDRQEVTITETLQVGNTSEVPTATNTVESEALGDGNYVIRKTTVPEVFAGRIFQKTKDDLTPQKFRGSQESVTTEETIAGIAQAPTLASGEFAKSEQQVNKFVKKVSKTSRDISTTTNLTEYIVTNQGQLAERKLTLSQAPQTLQPDAELIEGSIEELGDGRTIKTEVRVNKFFDGQTYSAEKPDNIPVEFRAEIPSLVDEKTIEGKADIPLLDGDILSKSEQQVTEFLKRTRTVSRTDIPTTSLSGERINQDGQKVIVTRTLAKGNQTINPSATISGSVDALGNGYTIKTVEEKDGIFDALTKTAQKPDTIPEKFKAKIITKKTDEVVGKNTAELPSLGDNEYLKTEQRLTEFTVQQTTVERASDYESIQSSDLEETWGISIPYEESIVNNFGNEENCEYDGLGDSKYIKRIYDINQLSQKLDNFYAETPTSINLNLPKILKEVTCVIQKSESVSEERNSIPYVLGNFGNLSFEDAGSFTSTVSFVPIFDVVLEEIWANDIEATLHIFFLKSEQLTIEGISSKCGANGFWPSLNPSSFSTVVFGKSESKTYTISVNRFHGVDPDGFIQRQNLKTNYNNSIIPVNLNIPNCIVEDTIRIQKAEQYNYSGTIVISFPTITNPSFTVPSGSESVPFVHNVLFNVDTTIKGNGQIPRSGKYVINSSSEPYKFGYFIVRAVTFDASKLGRD